MVTFAPERDQLSIVIPLHAPRLPAATALICFSTSTIRGPRSRIADGDQASLSAPHLCPAPHRAHTPAVQQLGRS
jgi:hypothetical protein